MNEDIAAGHRTIIKRAMRSVHAVYSRERLSTDDINQWARRNPSRLAVHIQARFRSAAQAWAEGSSSNNATTMDRCHAVCDRRRAQAESVLALFGVTAHYSGLLPSFTHDGTDYVFSQLAEALCRAVATHRVTRDGNELFRSTADECFVWLLDHQPASVAEATAHHGYAIEPIPAA